MKSNSFYGYIRVSTVKQGEFGVSLHEQRDAIERYAQRNNLTLTAWFEEQETAAKRGRPVFTEMLKRLKRREAEGVIIHKIDRSARNLKDWADLGELIDRGVAVHFSHESLDLHSRGGRLSADIQAVVASDFIRNLREETRKGFYGRLKQGLYPLPAPLGYVDSGRGKAKQVDPNLAPLVRRAFELYATGNFSLVSLQEELRRQGLRNTRSGQVSLNGLSRLLRNPFYVGLIRIHRSSETFPGVHEPIVSVSLFEKVQRILSGKVYKRVQTHAYTFRRLLRCKVCGYALIGERQKGNVYYRCHTKHPQATCIREDAVDAAISDVLIPLQLTDNELSELHPLLGQLRQNWSDEREKVSRTLDLHIKASEDRLTRLTDAYVDRLIEKDAFEERRRTLLLDKSRSEEKSKELRAFGSSGPDQVAQFLELAKNLHLNYTVALPDERRDLLRTITSNCIVDAKTLELTMHSPFQELANRGELSNGDPYRGVPRTWAKSLIDTLLQHFAASSEPGHRVESRPRWHGLGPIPQ